MFAVQDRDKTYLYDGGLSLGEIKKDLSDKHKKLSLFRTLRLYGLRYTTEETFFRMYKEDFNLSETRSMWDITLHELKQHMDMRIGSICRGRS